MNSDSIPANQVKLFLPGLWFCRVPDHGVFAKAITPCQVAVDPGNSTGIYESMGVDETGGKISRTTLQ